MPSLEPNDTAIVLTIRTGEASALFGADLEEDGRSGMGWTEAIARFANIHNSHQGYKVAHHGSINGHHDEIWSRFLSPNAWAAVTPYTRLKDPLPTKQDIDRILHRTPYAYITARSFTAPYKHPDTTVQSQLREMNVKVEEECSSQGHIRLRKNASDANSDWTVETFGDAGMLKKLG
jgi:beta-lactamase superfamily II metal-dependent hydrolase